MRVRVVPASLSPAHAYSLVPSAHSVESAEVIRHKLESGLAEDLDRNTVSLRETSEGLILSLREVGFFDSGSATLRANSMETFDRIGDVLTSIASNLRIEGHTDNVPIHTAQFQSNWELSSARATEVIRLLLIRENIGPQRLSAAGYAEYHPIADNSTEDGRRLNRRVDIVILAPHEIVLHPRPHSLPRPMRPSRQRKLLIQPIEIMYGARSGIDMKELVLMIRFYFTSALSLRLIHVIGCPAARYHQFADTSESHHQITVSSTQRG